jgi:hypothetical protein
MSIVVGALRLFGDPIGVSAPLVVGGPGVLMLVCGIASRARRRRFRSRVRIESDLPTGPRRVLLVETGMAGPGH